MTEVTGPTRRWRKVQDVDEGWSYEEEDAVFKAGPAFESVRSWAPTFEGDQPPEVNGWRPLVAIWKSCLDMTESYALTIGEQARGYKPRRSKTPWRQSIQPAVANATAWSPWPRSTRDFTTLKEAQDDAELRVPVYIALSVMRNALDRKDVPAAKLALEELRVSAKPLADLTSEQFADLFLVQINRPEWEWPYELPEMLDHEAEVDAIVAALDRKDPDEARRRMKQMRLWDKVHDQRPSRATGIRLAQSILRPEWNGGTF